jgi:hypothetical protein
VIEESTSTSNFQRYTEWIKANDPHPERFPQRGKSFIACACGNEARYINTQYEWCCSLCPLKQGIDSIRRSDVQALHAWTLAVLQTDGGPEQVVLAMIHDRPAFYDEERRAVHAPSTS